MSGGLFHRRNILPTYRLGDQQCIGPPPQLLGRSFQKARNFTASSHQNAGFSIWVFKNFPGVIPPNPHSGGATLSRTQHPAWSLASSPVLGPKPWSPSTFQSWLRPWVVWGWILWMGGNFSPEKYPWVSDRITSHYMCSGSDWSHTETHAYTVWPVILYAQPAGPNVSVQTTSSSDLAYRRRL